VLCFKNQKKKGKKVRAFNLGFLYKEEGNKHDDKNRMQTTWI
jgi:hypothetical protein